MRAITICNWGYRELAHNLNKTLLRVSEPPATVYVPDQETKSYFDQHGLPSILLEDSTVPREAVVFLGPGFSKMAKFKLRVLGSALAGSDEPFLYLDPDVAFFRFYQDRLPPITTDFTAQLNPWGTICTGVMVLMPNERTRAVFQLDPPEVDNDEWYVHKRIPQEKCTVSGLDGKLFVVGANRWVPECICYHYNFRVGLDAKVSSMKKDGVWLM